MTKEGIQNASGARLQSSVQNPFQELISASGNDPRLLQSKYESHRTARNAQCKAKILDRELFSGWNVDEILKKLIDNDDGQFMDPRNNVAFLARPPQHIRELVDDIQREIRQFAPTLWFAPSECLHMTALEVSNSHTESEVDAVVSRLEQSGILPDVANYTFDHRARLIKPMVSYDTTAMALSFVPASGEGVDSAFKKEYDRYTYHHLRRDIFNKVIDAGIEIESRYIVPSAHVTIARFISQDGFNSTPDLSGVDHGQVALFIEKIEEINQKLKFKCWPKEDGVMSSKGEWIVGQEKGLDACKGRSWYGNGDRLLLGRGFE